MGDVCSNIALRCAVAVHMHPDLGSQEGGGGGDSLQDLHGHDVDLLKVLVEEQVEPDSSLTCGLCEETSTGRSVCCRKAAHESPGDEAFVRPVIPCPQWLIDREAGHSSAAFEAAREAELQRWRQTRAEKV